MNNIAETILKFNAGREPERLAMKFSAMKQNPFVFMRGSCHLFYRDWPVSDKHLNSAPLAWISGDLHLENFGCYKGDNRLVYFDLNDFDEAALAPATWELGRWLTSIIVAADTLNLSKQDAIQLCKTGLDRYAAALRTGKARWLERETAQGMIRALLDPLTLRNRKEFLDSRTKLGKEKRRLKIDGKRALELPPVEKEAVMAFVREYANQQPNPDFYQPLDAARRIAGTGSLGLARYVILVEGGGSPDSNYLVDLKQAASSALTPYLINKQPKWQSEAHRVASIQQWAQAISPAFLTPVIFQNQPCILKGLQPTQDKLDLSAWGRKLKHLEQVIGSMGELIAWSHLRGGGRNGSAITDEWIAFGNANEWHSPLVEYATAYADKIKEDWKKFVHEYEQPNSVLQAIK
jgi:uncharacterized protein (DUF2252 family)